MCHHNLLDAPSNWLQLESAREGRSQEEEGGSRRPWYVSRRLFGPCWTLTLSSEKEEVVGGKRSLYDIPPEPRYGIQYGAGEPGPSGGVLWRCVGTFLGHILPGVWDLAKYHGRMGPPDSLYHANIEWCCPIRLSDHVAWAISLVTSQGAFCQRDCAGVFITIQRKITQSVCRVPVVFLYSFVRGCAAGKAFSDPQLTPESCRQQGVAPIPFIRA
jgi:hypothetical protein